MVSPGVTKPDDLDIIGATPCRHCRCPYVPWAEVEWNGREDGPLRFYLQCRRCRAQTEAFEDEVQAAQAWARGETRPPE